MVLNTTIIMIKLQLGTSTARTGGRWAPANTKAAIRFPIHKDAPINSGFFTISLIAQTKRVSNPNLKKISSVRAALSDRRSHSRGVGLPIPSPKSRSGTTTLPTNPGTANAIPTKTEGTMKEGSLSDILAKSIFLPNHIPKKEAGARRNAASIRARSQTARGSIGPPAAGSLSTAILSGTPAAQPTRPARMSPIRRFRSARVNTLSCLYYGSKGALLAPLPRPIPKHANVSLERMSN